MPYTIPYAHFRIGRMDQGQHSKHCILKWAFEAEAGAQLVDLLPRVHKALASVSSSLHKPGILAHTASVVVSSLSAERESSEKKYSFFFSFYNYSN